MTFKPTSIQINPLECKIYEGTICDKENCTEKECERCGMTENQKYYLTENFSCFGDIKFACKDNGTYLTVDGTIAVLNALVTQYQKLEKKNEELKYALSEMNAMYEEALASDCETERENSLLLDDVEQLRKETEQLKKEIEKLHEQILSHSIEFKSLHNDYRTLKLQDDELKERLENVLSELYCKDRELEKLGVNIECCDKNNQK